MFTLTGQIVSVRNLTKRNTNDVYAQEVQVMAGSDDYKMLHGVKDFVLDRRYKIGDQITVACNVKLNTYGNNTRLEILAFEDQTVISAMFKESKAA